MVYDYRDNKEKQISQLNNEQSQLKDEIEKSQNEYESVIDHATSEIENFLKKANTDSSVQ